MHAPEFQDQLRRTGEYHTPHRGPPLLHRAFGRFDGWYYAHILRVVAIGNRLARANRYDTAAWSRSSFDTIRAVEHAGGQVHITGARALATTNGPAVIIANHMSMAETFILPSIALAFGNVCFIVKESLLTYPVFGPILRACHPISVTRQNPRQDLKDVLTRGEEALRAGRSVVVFPQATRAPYFSPPDFNSLGVKLAARAGVPAVPLALKTDFQGNGKRIKEFGPLDRRQHMHYAFAAPLTATGNEKATHAAIVAFIRERITAWGGHVREGGADAPHGTVAPAGC